MRKIAIFVAVSIFFTLSIKAQTIDKDFQFWNETTISFPILKTENDKGEKVEKISFFINGSFRAGKNISKAIDERIGGGLDFILNKHITLTSAYLYRAGQPPSGGKEFEHRLRFEATLSNKWKHFSIKDRNRIEYRIRNSRGDSVRYRNKFTFTVPIKKDNKEIFAPFASTEPFYDFRDDKFTRNELSLGITKKVNKNLSADIFYLWQRNFGATLKNINAIGINLKFKVD